MANDKKNNGFTWRGKILVGILGSILIGWMGWVSSQCNVVYTNKSLIIEKSANLRKDVDKNAASISAEAAERKAADSKSNGILHRRITDTEHEARAERRVLAEDTREEMHDLKIIFMDTWKLMLEQEKAQKVREPRPSQYNGR